MRVIAKLLGAIFLFLLLFFVGLGKFLDLENERIINQLYLRNKDSVIEGVESREIIHGNENAVIIIHGFMDSPWDFTDLIDTLQKDVTVDIYAPLLPFHGKNLETASAFNPSEIKNSLENYLKTIASKYKSVTALGHSFGGTILINLAASNKLPQNIHLILYAPAIFIKENNFINRLNLTLYKLWRKYCNYPELGCSFPHYASGDTASKQYFDKEKTLRYVVIPATLELYQFDLENRSLFSKINRPFHLIVAKDDNRISFEEQEFLCEKNRNFCNFHPFDTGKHFIHWGKNKKPFEELLISLIKNNKN
jgi:esterase/lipase